MTVAIDPALSVPACHYLPLSNAKESQGMNCSKSGGKRFLLLPKDALEPNGPDDPLPYYYKPLVGRFYCSRIEQALSLLGPRYGAVLELGYGSGVLLPTLCTISDSVSGLDLTSDPIRVTADLAKIGLTSQLSRGDIREISYPRESFHLIVAISIFEHIPASQFTPILNRLFDLLCPGGELLVGMPRVDKLMSKAFNLIGYHKIDDHHVTNYRQFLNLASERFEVINVCHIPERLPVCAGLYFNMLIRKPLTA